jgi:hypothetical protein
MQSPQSPTLPFPPLLVGGCHRISWLSGACSDKVLGSMGKTLVLLGLWLSLFLTTLSTTAAGLPRPALDFPLPVDSYHDQNVPSLFEKLSGRIEREPLNLVATIIFFGAIVHTFLAGWFRKIAHNYQQSYDAIEYLLEAKDTPSDFGKEHDKLLFRAQLFYFMSEVEAVFGIWLIPLFVAITAFHGWASMVDYVGNVNVADAIFVVVIMAMTSSFRLESCHRNHLFQLAVLFGISERIRQTCDQRSRRRAGSRRAPADSLANYCHPYPVSLLDSRERTLSRARDPGHSFLSRLRLSHPAEPARDCPASAVTRRLLSCSSHHSRRVQQWWIGPVLGSLSRWPLMVAATILTAFNDNAAITYLASLVPGFSEALKYVVMAGAVTGGGLTVIANSPNPAGQSILASRFGDAGISPLYLFFGALVPTLIAGAAFMLLP